MYQDELSREVSRHFSAYEAYMLKNHARLYRQFYNNIHPPQAFGECVGIAQSAHDSDEDYEEIRRISREFCEKYPMDWRTVYPHP